MKKFFLNIAHGLKGAGIFFMLSMMFFTGWKILEFFRGNDLLLSKFGIAGTVALFVIAGFIYGVMAYRRKNHHYKVYSMSTKNFVINIIITLAFSGYFWYVLKDKAMPSTAIMVFFITAFVIFYAFSALVAHMHTHRKKKLPKIIYIKALLFNPIFVLMYFWAFSTVVYSSLYYPCSVTIIGIDKNEFTANTRNLDIGYDEKILSLDGTPIQSLSDVRTYLDSLETTKEVSMETNKKTYLVKTYMQDGKRYMGFLLRQDICWKE